jgi:hypothetical protein
MGLEQAKVGSFLNNATSVFDQLTRVAQGLLCIPSLLGKFLTGKSSLSGLAGALAGAIGNTVSNIVGTIIQNEIAFVGNLVAQTLRQQYQNIISILNTFAQIFNTAKSLFSKALDTLDFIKSSENCTYAGSAMLSCILSSAANLQKKIKKPASKLAEFNNQLTSSIAGKSGIINNYVQSNLRGLDKAKMQLNLQNFL